MGLGPIDLAGRKRIFNAKNIVRKLFVCSIIATSLILSGWSLVGAEFYVSASGTASGNGSKTKPWNLQTALKHPRQVQPGDTIWLRGGVYRTSNRPTKYYSAIKGAPNRPVIVRQFPGERAVIDGNITQLTGGWVNYWGFEIMNSIPQRFTLEHGSFPTAFWLADGPGTKTDFAVSGFDLRAPNVKLINLVIHDSVGGGIGISTDAANAEVSGAIVYYNGWQGGDRGHGHGIYAQKVRPNTFRMNENLIFANYALGLQATGTGPVVDNLQVEGNIFFSNSDISEQHQGNLLIGSFSDAAHYVTLTRNFIYQTHPSGSDCNIGYVGGIINGRLASNYFATHVAVSTNNKNVETVDDIIIDDEHADQQPNLVEVRTNQYEAGRATIIIYNWEERDEVEVDLHDLFPVGTPFHVRNAQDVLGPVVVQGTYDGLPIKLPMTNLFVAKPRATATPLPTAPRFNIFLVYPVTSPAPSDTAPTLSAIADRTIFKNSSSSPIRVTIQDKETPASLLNLSIRSSNSDLVSPHRINFAGTDATPLITVIPERDQVGQCSVTLAVSDGIKTTMRSFMVYVVNPP